MGREVFTRPFAAALQQACAARGLNQKQIGALIAARQHQHRPRGPHREQAIATARKQWPGRLSAWKKGGRLPASADELFLALDVIAPDTPRRQWEQWWRQARDQSTPTAVVPPLSPPVSRQRSVYLRQVERIAPPELIGRQDELAELAAFCLGERQGPYVWWRAAAWSGKSALLSTFVLHPPEEVRDRVRIVSFFITARLAAQDTRDAFTQVLLEQLADLTGQDLPQTLTEVNREAHLRELLAQAAHTCQVAGGRMVLVVDGLDEDRGITLGSEVHSIAGLLPADPPAGMRVIVAGRPNPPIPDDVPDHHPLRDPQIIRHLEASGYARDLQRLSQSELKRLLNGSPLEQDLLGLLTAARGGLSGPDLGELTGADLWKIEDVLHTVTGRTFTRRPSQRAPDTHPEVYLLGHEELHSTACNYFDAKRLSGYRDRLHAWGDTYRTSGWPARTPEYLLHDYSRLLTTLRDVPRLVALATDTARHNWMLDVTGGDGDALTEIRTALGLIAAQDTPDLTTALRLARHRDQLTDRNTHTPTALPAVWATVGQYARAQALAQSITNPSGQARALARVAGALARVGRHEQAAAVAAAAEQAARSITDPSGQAQALGEVAEVLAQLGSRAACRVAVTVCVVGRWTVAVKSVLQLEPTASVVVLEVAHGSG